MTTIVPEICPTRTQERIKAGAVLVDVREDDEVRELAYDVPRLIHVPLSQFDSRYGELPKNKDLIIVCKTGGCSFKAAMFLIKHGYTNVTNMQYGIIRWIDKGFPTKGISKTPVSNSEPCCEG